MLIAAVFAGCGGSEKRYTTKDARPASKTTTEPDSGQLSAAEFAALNAVDDRLQAAVHEFQNNLRTCTGSGDDATAQDCFASRYEPFGQSVVAALGAIGVAQDAAGGECVNLLGKGKDSARELQQTSEAMRTAFAEGDFANVDAAAFVSAFEGYRSNMDSALAACGKDQGAVQSQPAAPEPTARPSDDVGKTVTSGGIKLKVMSLRRASTVRYESGTQSEETPNATARTVRAPQGGHYVFVKTRLTNDHVRGDRPHVRISGRRETLGRQGQEL